MMYHRLTLLLILLFATAAVAEQSIWIDFGSAEHPSRDEWNNVTEPRDVGVLLEQAMDNKGHWTSVRLAQTNAFSGFNLDGYVGSDSPLPGPATVDSFYLGDGDNRAAQLQLEGLSPTERYSLTFYASRLGGELPRRGIYRVGDKSVELDASDNMAQPATLDGLQPDLAGSLTIDITCAEPRGFAYLNALKITGKFTRMPLRQEPADEPDGPPLVSARAWAIADGGTGELLWGHRHEVPRQMASITKVMTAHLIFQWIDKNPAVLDEVVTVSPHAANTTGSSAGLNVGERILVRDLMYGLLLPSGNDAAVALAEHFDERCPGVDSEKPHRDSSIARFVAAMNARAAQLGMNDTRYFDPHGNSGNRSTAHDLVRLAHHVLGDERFRQYVGTSVYRAELTQLDGKRRAAIWKNTNRLLGITGYHGVKTGTTSGAGSCLLSVGQRGERQLLVVVLGSSSNEGRYIDARNLFRWAWSQAGPKRVNMNLE